MEAFAIQGIQIYEGQDNFYEYPNKAQIMEMPSIASTSSYQFGGDSGERMIQAQRGLLERQSLEDHYLSADGEEMSACEFFFSFAFQ